MSEEEFAIVIGTKKAAKIVGCTRTTIFARMRNGSLSWHKNEYGSNVFYLSDLEALARSLKPRVRPVRRYKRLGRDFTLQQAKRVARLEEMGLGMRQISFATNLLPETVTRILEWYATKPGQVPAHKKPTYVHPDGRRGSGPPTYAEKKAREKIAESGITEALASVLKSEHQKA